MARVYEEHLNSLKAERDRALEEVHEWKREVASARKRLQRKDLNGLGKNSRWNR